MMCAYPKKLSAVLLAFVLGFGLVTAPHAAGQGKRGDYPQCQKCCLSTLETSMSGISEEYGKTGNRLRYQERVERARVDYDDCIANCKDLIPVK